MYNNGHFKDYSSSRLVSINSNIYSVIGEEIRPDPGQEMQISQITI